MARQNTQKQILAMVLLMIFGLFGLGVYVWFDDGRRPEAEERLLLDDVEFGAELFARNCRVCHGNTGLGSAGNPSLIGPPLNKAEFTVAWRRANDPNTDSADQSAAIGQLGILRARLGDTISCGRNGTPMPPWAIDQGGSLNDFKIATLVLLITTNAENAWELVAEEAHETDEITINGLRAALGAALDGGDPDLIEATQGALEAAETRFGAGLPVVAATPSLTANSCGQR